MQLACRIMFNMVRRLRNAKLQNGLKETRQTLTGNQSQRPCMRKYSLHVTSSPVPVKLVCLCASLESGKFIKKKRSEPFP